jgi:UDP-N-acetyl-D-glucosamine dehydrogenase
MSPEKIVEIEKTKGVINKSDGRAFLAHDTDIKIETSRGDHVSTTTMAVVGLGYVGLPLAILAASRGFKVVGFDIDEVKVAQLEKREANYLNKEEAEKFQQARSLRVTADQTKLADADTFIVCVPTPVHEDHLPDLGPLENASKIVGAHLKKGALVVIESTVNPGACEEICLPILEKESGLSRDEFFFAHCPERINPGDSRWDVRTIPRVVGGLNDESLRRASRIYRSLIDAEIVRMDSIKEAEAVKMVENSFRDINIAFVNELAMAFDRAGIDVVNVLLKGASTKPFGFMPHYPGCGVGGHCIPVDPYYLIRYGQENGFAHRFLMTARRINNNMPLYTVSILEDALEEHELNLHGSTVALLGLAYKRDVPDVRESPSIAIKNGLIAGGATVRVFDPYILRESTVKSLEEALEGADAALIATDHTLFQTLTPQDFEKFGIPVVVDGRNCLDKDSFVGTSVTYRGIGRR